jgi:signal transduction histidine kinase
VFGHIANLLGGIAFDKLHNHGIMEKWNDGIMVFRGLKTNIAINIIMLIFVAMLLINFVALMMTQRGSLKAEGTKGFLLLSALEDKFIEITKLGDRSSQVDARAYISSMLNEAGISCGFAIGKSSPEIFFGENTCTSENNLVKLTRQTILSNKKAIRFAGKRWGVFWRQDRYMIISVPFMQNEEIVAAASIVTDLDGIYQQLRASQKIFFIYILINTMILASIGIYRVSKVYLLPVSRLAIRAEEYEEDDEIIFSVRKEDNELNRLSKALNNMLRRISADKEKLRSTVLSLEKANLELKMAQKEIVRAEKLASVGRLSAGIAHEIGNPIGIVIGYLDLLKQKGIPEEEKIDYIQRTEEEIERINSIIRQLLEVSRPSNSGRKTVSIHDLIHDISEVLQIQPLMSNIELELRLSAESDTVLADPNQLHQVFLNLIINAADAISLLGEGANGKLLINTEIIADPDSTLPSQPEMLKIIFQDNGPGIPEENIGNIFDPFFTTKEPGKGTGLGLSVSFMIVEGFGGNLTVASEVGLGTSMVIYLPIHVKETKKTVQNLQLQIAECF